MPERKIKKDKPAADKAARRTPGGKKGELHRHDTPISLADAVKKREEIGKQLKLQSGRLERVQKVVEQRVRTSKEYFERFPEIGLITDPDGIIVDANRKATEAFQAPEKELSGKSLGEFVLEEDRIIFQLHLQRCRKKDQREHFQMRLKSAEGKQLDVDALLAPFGGEEHRVQKIFWAIRVL
jgi:PAS domain S-box-containing protein